MTDRDYAIKSMKEITFQMASHAQDYLEVTIERHYTDIKELMRSYQKLILENQVVLEELDMECQEKINEDMAYALSYTSVYKGYKQDKIEMRGDRAEMSDFPLYLNTVAGGLDRRDQTIGGFSFVVKIYAVPVVEIIG